MHGDPRGAVRIFAATSSTHDFPASIMIDTPVVEDDIVATARRTLGDDEFKLAWAEGQSITLARRDVTSTIGPRSPAEEGGQTAYMTIAASSSWA